MGSSSTILGIGAAVLCIAVLIVIHEFGHFIVARLFGMRVKRFSLGFFKPLVEWKPKGSETTYAIGALPLGGYVQVDGLSPGDESDPEDPRNYVNKPAYARLAMVVAGPLANFLLASVIYVTLFIFGYPVPAAVLGNVFEDHPAAEAGLEAGDEVLSINEQDVDTWDEMAAIIYANPGKTVSLRFSRGDQERTVEVTPEPMGDIGVIGVEPSRVRQELLYLGPGEATVRGFSYAGKMTLLIALTLTRMATCQQSAEGISGPIGITTQIEDQLNLGWRHLMATLAMLSLSLCVINFLPIPAMDGGRAAFLLVEVVTRRHVNRKIEGYVHAGGFIVLLALLLLVSVLDVRNCMS